MNESENDSTFLFNRAFVGRQLPKDQGDTNRFAGGIIGNQNNSTTSGWNISHCVNYGAIYCYRTHYSGGIIGQWTGNGGNIEDCRNYGHLFTTQTVGWLGAASGIVAQLYHANANNEYNIISCRNYGSIYGRYASDIWTCANDSAGILGNITAYRIEDEANSPKYKIQVLDCINEAGVVIHSTSMASGIVGFFSADDVEKMSGNKEIETNIKKSTANIELRIERCQNYATELKGKNFVGGIFGDRYGDKGCQKTTVKDCYSVNSSNYNKYGFPIYSFKNGAGSASNMKAENRVRNYVGNQVSFTNLKLTRDTTIGKEEETIQRNDVDGDGYFGGNAQYAKYWYLMYDKTEQKYLVAMIDSNATINNNWAYITEKGYIKAKDTQAFCGQVLFYLDAKTDKEIEALFSNGDSLMDYITKAGSEFDEWARESYRRIEGIKKDKNELEEPESATATVGEGKIKIDIEPKALPNGERQEKCDPFEYQVYVTSEENFDPNNETIEESNTYKLYNESGDFNIPKGISGKAKIWVRAVSMYDDVTPSKWIEAGEKQIKEILPTPEPRLELIYKDGAYKYRLKLENEDDYKKYTGWQVTMKVGSLKTCTLDANKLEEEITVSEETTCQIISYASSPDNAYEQSAESSEQVFIPAYRPRITLNTWTPQATPKFEVTGTNLDDLGIQVTLDASDTGLIENPPIYRAELIGTWNPDPRDKSKKREDVVFAKTDMLTSSGGKTVANFTNLPEYLRYATNLRVRLWYAESGLGPVYTYWKVDDETSANITELVTANTDGSDETWSYSHSTVLEKGSLDGNIYYFDPYKNWSDSLFTWLPAPVLNHADEKDYIVEPTLDENDPNSSDKKYRFTWDKKPDGTDCDETENAQYSVELTGIIKNEDGTDQRVTIDTSEDYKGGKELAVEGADWNYSEVELKVTRIGDSTKKQIGLSSTGRYKVKQRLTTPSQPMVELIDTNELNYRITWDAIDPDEGCDSYDLYIRQVNEDGTETTIKKDSIAADKKKDGRYSVEENLEDYAGKEITIYLVAIAKKDKDSTYIDSAAGIGYTFTVPERLPEPKVEWKTNWTYDRNNPLSESKFENGNGDMRISLTAQNNDSIPTSGGGYILKAYVYKSQAEAEEALKGADHKKAILEYPTGSDSNGVVEMTSSSQKEYFHNLEGISIKHAGQWIVFQARLSAGSGNVSSVWTYSDPYQLPYVKLSKAEVVSDKKEYTQEVIASTNSNPDIPDEKETQDWTATNRILEWDSVKSADVFELALTGTNGSSNLRVIEDQENKVVRVQNYVEVKDQDGKEVKDENGFIKMEWKDIGEITPEFKTTSEREEWENDKKRTRTYQIDTFKTEILKSYESNGENTNYSFTSYAQLEVVPSYKYDSAKDEDIFTGFSYTLKLPDMEKLVNTSGRNVMASLSDNDKKDFMPTTQVDITANVETNLDGKTSEKYIPADLVEVEMEQN